MSSNLRPSLNGGQTRPLTKIGIATLKSIAARPRPYQEINAGLIDRFSREDLIEIYKDVSPYPTHKGALTRFVRISEDGLRTLREIG